MLEITKVPCPKCGTILLLHRPYQAIANDQRMSLVALVPSWSIDERVCRGCRCTVAPVITAVQNGWMAYDPPESKAIVEAGPEALRRLKDGEVISIHEAAKRFGGL